MLPTQKAKGELFLASSLRDGLEDNDITQVKTLLLSKDADPNVLIPTQGIAPFHLVIGNDSETFAEEVTKLFLRHGGNPNVKSTDGMTPVHVAAAWGRIPVLELLLANGGDPLSLDEDGRSPFHYAFDGGFYDAVAMLAKYCGKSQEQEEEEEPKYKLTLDKILISKGNVVAEYVPSETSCSSSVKSESSQISMEFNHDLKGIKADPLKSSEFVSPLTDGSSTNGSDRFNSNVTIRRNHSTRQKKCTISNRLASDANLDITFSDRSVEEERLLIGQIINRLSNSFVNDPVISNDAITTKKRLITNNNANSASTVKNTRSFLPLPKYHSYNLKLKKTPQQLADTSIISKSPNIRFPTKNDRTPTPSKRIGLSPKSYTCKSKYNNATPPSRLGKPNEVRIKSASSTPKKKQYRSRLYESTKLTRTQEKSKNLPSIQNITKSRTILDKTYRKNQFGVLSYSPDAETVRKNIDRKHLAKNIAVKLDDCMYDEYRESEPYEYSTSEPSCDQTRINSPLNNRIKNLKPLRNCNNINKEMAKEKTTPKRCNVALSKPKVLSPHNFCQQKTPDKLMKSRLKQPVTFESELPKSELKSEERDFQPSEEKNRLKTLIYDSPGSSKPVSSCLSENSGFFGSRHETIVKKDEDDKFWMEMDEVCLNKCATPPASVSFLVKTDSPSSNNDSLDRDLGVGTSFYSDYSSGDLSTSDFYEAYHYGKSNPPVFPNSRIMAESRASSESFVSVQEEYLYEDAEEGVAFTERHLCVIPSSDMEDKSDDKEKKSLIDQFEDLSIDSRATTSTVSPRESFIKTLQNDNILRERLTALGEQPGPITKTTFDVYLKRLWRLERAGSTVGKQLQIPSEERNEPKINSRIADTSKNIPNFLLSIDWTTKQQFYRDLEENAFKEYANPNSTRNYRGGVSKNSFCYLLLDPRITLDLPRTGNMLKDEDRWKRFLNGVFYVGKGKAARPAAHLYDAWGIWSKKKQVETLSRKLQRILDIWNDGKGVVCLHVFSHTMEEEAFSREAAMINALDTVHLTNCNRGTFYGYVTTMSIQEKRSLGKYLLYKSMEIFMHEGERQLFPRNILKDTEQR